MGDKFFNDWAHWGWSQPYYYNAIVKIVDEKEKKGNGLITLKDIIELRPRCRICIANLEYTLLIYESMTLLKYISTPKSMR